MGTREVITLQFGEFANHVGSHYWNLQDESIGVHGHDSEVNHQVLYRSGQTERGEATLVPRLLLFDLRSNLGPLREGGYLYGQSHFDVSSAGAAAAAWDGAVQTVAQEPAYKNAFLRYLDAEGQGGPTEGADDSTADTHLQQVGTFDSSVPSVDNIFGLAATVSDFHRSPRRGGSGGGGGGGGGDGDSDDDYDSDDDDFEDNCGGGEKQKNSVGCETAAMPAPLQAAEELEARADADVDFELDTMKHTYWSDYLKAHLHPRSIITLPYAADGGLDLFHAGRWPGAGGGYGGGSGSAYTVGTEVADAANDSLRYFLEECDWTQALHASLDASGGFGGFATDMVTAAADEIGRVPIVISAALPQTPAPRGDNVADNVAIAHARALRRQRVCASLALAELREVCSLYIPAHVPTWDSATLGLGMPTRYFKHLRVEPPRAYHSAAVIGAALDTATLPYRLRDGRNAVNRVSQWLDGLIPRPAMPVAALSAALPFITAAIAGDTPANDSRARGSSRGAPVPSPLERQLTRCEPLNEQLRNLSFGPGAGRRRAGRSRSAPFSQSIVLRGLAAAARNDAASSATAAAAAGDVADVANERLAASGTSPMTATAVNNATYLQFVGRSALAPARRLDICAADTPMAVPLSFPRFFASRLSRDGRMLPVQLPRAAQSGDDSSVAHTTAAPVAAATGAESASGGVTTCPTATEIASTPSVAVHLRLMARTLEQHACTLEFEQAGLARDDLEESRAALLDLADGYGAQDEDETENANDVDDSYGSSELGHSALHTIS